MEKGIRRVATVIRFCLTYLLVTGALAVALLWATARGPQGGPAGTVTDVPEGDRLVLSGPEGEMEVRLAGIDSPEVGQPFFEEARRKLEELGLGQTVILRRKGGPGEGIALGEAELPDGKILNREMVKAGLAWWDRGYPEDRTLRRLERKAESARRGLWSQARPISPWDHRKKLAEALPTPTPEPIPEEVMESVRAKTNRYIGDSATKIYYWPGCPEYVRLDALSSVVFSSPYEAQSAGYRKAATCD